MSKINLGTVPGSYLEVPISCRKRKSIIKSMILYGRCKKIFDSTNVFFYTNRKLSGTEAQLTARASRSASGSMAVILRFFFTNDSNRAYSP